MSTNNSWFPGRCQVCGAGATTQINGAEWYCAIHVPNRPLSYPIAGRPEDLAELSALRAEIARLTRERDSAREACDASQRHGRTLMADRLAAEALADELARVVRAWVTRPTDVPFHEPYQALAALSPAARAKIEEAS